MINSIFKHGFNHSYRNILLKPYALQSHAKVKEKQKTYYQILELPQTAPQNNIRKNYLRLAKIYHPDIYKGADKTRFQLIQQAYKTLSDVGERRKYNQSLGIRQGDPKPYEGESGKQTGKPKNDFNYEDPMKEPQSQVNRQEEYDKFFKKKKTTHFEQIRIYEAPEFRNMNFEERTRRHVADLYQQQKEMYNLNHQQTFQNILNDHIQQKNNMHENMIKQEKKVQRQKDPKRSKIKKIGYYALLGVLSVVLLPNFIRLVQDYVIERNINNFAQSKIRQADQLIEEAEIRTRFRY